MQHFIDLAYGKMLSPKIKSRSERIILGFSILSYICHLVLIFLNTQGVLNVDSKFLTNPIAAVYTPFTFILVYEVYLLIYYLPKSISFYIGKQYEIITLIVIRRIFKDIASLELTSKWFQNKGDLQFTYDVLTSLILFILIYFFYQKIIKRSSNTVEKTQKEESRVQKFIYLKKGIAVLLVPLLVIMAIYSFSNWLFAAISDYQNGVVAFKNINNIFFDEFFTVLIIIDVLLLLSSFFLSDEFHKIIRNSGFVISTILIKVSFSVEGLVNNALIIGAVLFGFLILIIHNKFEQSPLLRE